MREADECTNGTLERPNTDCLIIRTKALTESGAQFSENGRRIKKLGSGEDLYSPPIDVVLDDRVYISALSLRPLNVIGVVCELHHLLGQVHGEHAVLPQIGGHHRTEGSGARHQAMKLNTTLQRSPTTH